MSGLVEEMYLIRFGRFVSFIFYSILYSISEWTGEHFYWSIMVLLFGAWSIYLVMKKILPKVSNFLLINIGFFIFSLFILMNIDFAAFFWVCALGYYLFPSILILTIYNVNLKRPNLSSNIALILFALIIGGFNESFVPFAILFILINLIFHLKNYNYSWKKLLRDTRFKRITLLVLIIFLVFVVVIIAPGNYNHIKNFDQSGKTGVIPFFINSVQAFFMFFYFMVFRIPYFILLFVVFAYLGIKLRNQISIDERINRLLFPSLGFIIFYIWLNTLPNVYLTGGFGLQRTYTHSVYLLVVFVSVISFIWGMKNKNTRLSKILTSLVVPIMIAFVFNQIYVLNADIPNAQKYALDDKKRIAYLQELKESGNKDTVLLEPLHKPKTFNFKSRFYTWIKRKDIKSPSLYYTNEIDTTGTSRNNVMMERYFNFGFPFKLRVNNKNIHDHTINNNSLSE